MKAYAVGHFNNDLCASMWFVYLLWYLKDVVELDATLAGYCLLSGQIADGITTPIVGLLSDKFNTRIGKRMPWFIFGTIFVIPTFLGIFAYPAFANERNEDGAIKNPVVQKVWYTTLPALFNVGWAAVQISHMAIVNSLSTSIERRDVLVNYRNGFTYGANIVVLFSALIVFLYFDDKILQFRILGFLCIGLGLLTSIYYIFTIQEVKLTEEAKKYEQLLN